MKSSWKSLNFTDLHYALGWIFYSAELSFTHNLTIRLPPQMTFFFFFLFLCAKVASKGKKLMYLKLPDCRAKQLRDPWKICVYLIFGSYAQMFAGILPPLLLYMWFSWVLSGLARRTMHSSWILLTINPSFFPLNSIKQQTCSNYSCTCFRADGILNRLLHPT